MNQKVKKLLRIYLASPYSHKDPRVVEDRYGEAILATAALMKRFTSLNVFSPIVHSHPLAKIGGLRGDWEFWKALDEDFIDHCDEVWVLEIPGWRESTGVQAEIKIAEATGKPVKYVRELRGKYLVSLYSRPAILRQ